RPSHQFRDRGKLGNLVRARLPFDPALLKDDFIEITSTLTCAADDLGRQDDEAEVKLVLRKDGDHHLTVEILVCDSSTKLVVAEVKRENRVYLNALAADNCIDMRTIIFGKCNVTTCKLEHTCHQIDRARRHSVALLLLKGSQGWCNAESEPSFIDFEEPSQK